jgi:hypothetical protein
MVSQETTMNAETSTTTGYSPFWPVFVVFMTLIVLQGVYVIGDLKDRERIKRAQAEIAPMLTQAQKITQVVEDLGKELLTLSNAKNTQATKIVNELNIKLKHPAQ